MSRTPTQDCNSFLDQKNITERKFAWIPRKIISTLNLKSYFIALFNSPNPIFISILILNVSPLSFFTHNTQLIGSNLIFHCCLLLVKFVWRKSFEWEENHFERTHPPRRASLWNWSKVWHGGFMNRRQMLRIRVCRFATQSYVFEIRRASCSRRWEWTFS